MIEKIDKFITKTLKDKYGNSFERRNYYNLSIEEKEYLKDTESFGILYIVDVTYDNYIYVNLYKEGNFRILFKEEDFSLMETHYYGMDDFYKIFKCFLTLVDKYTELKISFDKISNGEIPENILRESKLKTILE